ncbi:SCO4848 family membrane protein [Allokutzneria oryzae]|uniref:SCO4848 family membrane protein n=1 Tax=Allokutzneria oryzae TaxID=1378989 RepID=A0ABV5ZUT7_9PSEU
MKLTRRASLFLLAFAVWTWLIWPNFMLNIAKDPRSFAESGAPTTFFTVHLVLVLTSLALGTVIGVIGWRGFRADRADRAASSTD